MSVSIFQGYWTRKIVKDYPNCLFVYGDNDRGFGKGGQAIIRGLKNTIGIPTKKYPSNREKSFYTDEEYDKNCQKIDKAIEKIKKVFYEKGYDYLVLPKDGFGTGLSQLPKKAPDTYKYLCEAVEELIRQLS